MDKAPTTSVATANSNMSPAAALALVGRYRDEGRLTDAEALCQRILANNPDMPDAVHEIGLVAYRGGQFAKAIEYLARATSLSPATALYHVNLGEVLRQSGQPAPAVESARRALALEPNMPVALSNLGAALFDLRDYKEAVAVNRRAVEARPGVAECHSNLGHALYRLRRFDEAINSYRRALELKPNHVDALANLGTSLSQAGHDEEARARFRQAIALAPDHANAHASLGILLLARGDFAEGWSHYEWRSKSSEPTGLRFLRSHWQGESLAGKHIYVEAEQGIGDTIHFVRYVPLLVARAARVTLRVQKDLVSLLKESLSGVTVLGPDGVQSRSDRDAALLSLPRLFKTRLESIPGDVPYLTAPDGIRNRWRERLGSMQGLKVGIAWAGNAAHIHDARRSLDAALFAPLAKMSGASFASLQVGARAGERDKLPKSVVDLSPELADFAETAGAIAALDLVITVDTAVAHVAGAIGKPVWLLLPAIADWRWLIAREDSPWYPTMRLFRQRPDEAWAAVFARVLRELKRVARGDTAPLTPFLAEGKFRASLAATIMQAETAQAPGAAELENSLGGKSDAHALAGIAKPTGATGAVDAETSHQLGLEAYQAGRLDEAVVHVARAVSIDPEVAMYHANLGELFRLMGRIDEAVSHGQRAVVLDPQSARAHSNLGIALFEQGELESALAEQDRAIALDDSFAQAHSNRGNALQALKRLSEAEPCYRRALELRPDFPDALNNLGTCLRELGKFREAESVYRRALVIQPNDPDTLDNLALALRDLGEFDGAADLLARAVAIAAQDERFLVHYGSVLLSLDKQAEAARIIKQAMALNPGNHETLSLMSRVELERGHTDDAIAFCKRAIALRPDYADAHNNLGIALREGGQIQQAEAAFTEAARLRPEMCGVYHNLSDVKRFTADDAHLAVMETLDARDNLAFDERMNLDYALGKAYADIKDYRRSFAHLLKANAARRATVSYDESASIGLFERIKSTFTAEMIQARSGLGDPSRRPIFIIGMPRSGTTLVEQILASHPAVHGAGELPLIHDIAWNVRGAENEWIGYPDFAPLLDEGWLKRFGREYLDRLSKIAPQGERVTDKMPANYYYAGLIHLALPNSVIIHCRRDPADTCVSCFSMLFAREQTHTYDLAELGRYYRRYQDLMSHWHHVLPPRRMLDVVYEDVVADMESQARQLLDHCGLPWDPRCLDFHRNSRTIRTASASQVRKPIYTTSVSRWRVYEEYLAPLLEALA
jgi:tetratricopeptide (TPR) repeat protein